MTGARGSGWSSPTSLRHRPRQAKSRAAVATARRIASERERDPPLSDVCDAQCLGSNCREAIAEAWEIACDPHAAEAFVDKSGFRLGAAISPGWRNQSPWPSKQSRR